MFHYFKKFWFRNLVYLVIAAVQAGLTIVTALLAAAELNALIKFDFNGFLKWTLLDVRPVAWDELCGRCTPGQDDSKNGECPAPRYWDEIESAALQRIPCPPGQRL